MTVRIPGVSPKVADTDTMAQSKGEYMGSIKVSQKPPTSAELDRVANLPVLDASGQSHAFRSLYGHDKSPRRVLIIFVRHFFCGNCQEYLRTLCSSVTPESLAALPTPTDLVIIGCGSPELIDFYAQTTSCSFPIYADPTKQLYHQLGMARTLNLGSQQPEYMQRSILSVAIESAFQSLRMGRKIFRGGDYWQVGGEFLFDTHGTVAWCHRMSNTRDHAEVPELRRQLGLDDAAPPNRKRWSMDPALLRRSISRKRQSWSRSRSRTPAPAREDSIMEQVQEEGASKEQPLLSPDAAQAATLKSDSDQAAENTAELP